MLIREGGRRPEWDGLTKYAIRRYPDAPTSEALALFINDRARAGLGALQRVRPDGPTRRVRRTKMFALEPPGYVCYRMRTTSLSDVYEATVPAGGEHASCEDQKTTVSFRREARTFCVDRLFHLDMLAEQRKRDWLAEELWAMRRQLRDAVRRYVETGKP